MLGLKTLSGELKTVSKELRTVSKELKIVSKKLKTVSKELAVTKIVNFSLIYSLKKETRIIKIQFYYSYVLKVIG
jgi:mRNA-degrading endonuclease RelE of RelBE toxin-antitoxin system